jgi:cytochrome c oxidase assembly protein subunit 17
METTVPDQVKKPEKKICCACPETKVNRDNCLLIKSEEECKQEIELHIQCLRKEGFNI